MCSCPRRTRGTSMYTGYCGRAIPIIGRHPMLENHGENNSWLRTRVMFFLMLCSRRDLWSFSRSDANQRSKTIHSSESRVSPPSVTCVSRAKKLKCDIKEKKITLRFFICFFFFHFLEKWQNNVKYLLFARSVSYDLDNLARKTLGDERATRRFFFSAPMCVYRTSYEWEKQYELCLIN